MNADREGTLYSGWWTAVICALKLGLGVALVGLLISTRRFDPHAYGALVREHRAVFLLAVLLAQCTTLLLPLVRWWLLVRAQGIRITLANAVRLGLMGAFANLFVPGNLGIDGVRLLYLRQHHREQWIPGAASVVVDRLLGVVALLTLGGGCSLILLTQSQNQWLFRLLLVNGSLLVGLVGGFVVLCRFLKIRLIEKLRRLRAIHQAVQAILVYRARVGTLACGFALSLLGHFAVCAAACFALLALDYPVSLPAVFTVTPVVTMSRALPITPLGLGVSDGVAAFLYPVVALHGGAEVQMLLRGTLSLVLLTSGLAYFTRIRPVAVPKEEPIDASEEALIQVGC